MLAERCRFDHDRFVIEAGLRDDPDMCGGPQQGAGVERPAGGVADDPGLPVRPMKRQNVSGLPILGGRCFHVFASVRNE